MYLLEWTCVHHRSILNDKVDSLKAVSDIWEHVNGVAVNSWHLDMLQLRFNGSKPRKMASAFTSGLKGVRGRYMYNERGTHRNSGSFFIGPPGWTAYINERKKALVLAVNSTGRRTRLLLKFVTTFETLSRPFTLSLWQIT